jgi:SEC-C motif-containing protein
MTQENSTSTCPCRAREEKKIDFAECCGPYLARTARAPTAEALMRSRYSAFVKHDIDYLHDTLAPEQRKDFSHAAAEDWAKKSHWTGLDIVETEEGDESDSTGTVTFAARCIRDGKTLTHREKSLFRRDAEEGWLFAGELVLKSAPLVLGKQTGRNDPCPCGSGKKYKKCCGAAA